LLTKPSMATFMAPEIPAMVRMLTRGAWPS
jgi:hypothetical protein